MALEHLRGLVHGLDGVRQVRDLLLVRLVLLLAQVDELLEARGGLRDLRPVRAQRTEAITLVVL